MRLLFAFILLSQACFGQNYDRPIINDWAITTRYKNPWVSDHRSSGPNTLRLVMPVSWSCDSIKKTVTLFGGTSDSVYHYDSVTRYQSQRHGDQDTDGYWYYVSRPTKLLLVYYRKIETIVVHYKDHRTIYNN